MSETDAPLQEDRGEMKNTQQVEKPKQNFRDSASKKLSEGLTRFGIGAKRNDLATVTEPEVRTELQKVASGELSGAVGNPDQIAYPNEMIEGPSDTIESQQPLSGETSDTKKVRQWEKEGPITPDELRESQDFEFGLNKPVPGQEPGNAHFKSEDGVTTITAKFPADVRSRLSELPVKQRELLDISEDGTTLYYPKKERGDKNPSIDDNQSAQDTQPPDEGYTAPLLMDGTQRIFPENERKAQKVTPEQVAEMIRTTDPDKLVMYTGAGISMGGKERVWGMTELKNNLHVNNGSDAFLEALLNDPEALKEAFTTFDQQMNTPNVTDAHKAIKEIMDAKPGATLLTQNLDRNHEHSGIRPKHSNTIAEFYEYLKKRADNAILIVVAGLHGDDIGFLQWAATHNPNVQIVAIDLGEEVAEYPTFLNKDNFILPGDAQETLPKVAEALKNEQTS